MRCLLSLGQSTNDRIASAAAHRLWRLRNRDCLQFDNGSRWRGRLGFGLDKVRVVPAAGTAWLRWRWLGFGRHDADRQFLPTGSAGVLMNNAMLDPRER